MKKYMILIITIVWCLGLLQAQTAQTPANPNLQGFRNVRQYVETQELIIEFKSQIPASGVYLDKTDTYQSAGEYKFNFDL
ncbi:MAG: hypothetical protein PHO32_07290, partial [Candidatus Cloacimonetes bacterium]|nr:hypothetical protein [Candidatus Cloacimonadota bacterium]